MHSIIMFKRFLKKQGLIFVIVFVIYQMLPVMLKKNLRSLTVPFQLFLRKDSPLLI